MAIKLLGRVLIMRVFVMAVLILGMFVIVSMCLFVAVTMLVRVISMPVFVMAMSVMLVFLVSMCFPCTACSRWEDADVPFLHQFDDLCRCGHGRK